MWKRRLAVTGLVVLTTLVQLKAQGTISSMSAMGLGSGGSFVSGIGYSSFSGNNENLNSFGVAVFQGFDLGTVTSLDEPFSDLKVTAFPNPTRYSINLRLDQLTKPLSYELCFVDGRIAQRGVITEGLTQLDLMPFNAHIFLLTIHDQGSLVKRVKIIKH